MRMPPLAAGGGAACGMPTTFLSGSSRVGPGDASAAAELFVRPVSNAEVAAARELLLRHGETPGTTLGALRLFPGRLSSMRHFKALPAM